MKLKINDNMIIVGTPEEMAEFIWLTQMPEDGGPLPEVPKAEVPDDE